MPWSTQRHDDKLALHDMPLPAPAGVSGGEAVFLSCEIVAARRRDAPVEVFPAEPTGLTSALPWVCPLIRIAGHYTEGC